MIAWLLSGLGLLILLLAGDALVKGAVNLSLRLGVPALIVSLTIVAFGTSAPELLISISAILDDKPGLALGNVVGSNTANILLVLGVPALLATMHTSRSQTKKSYLMMVMASLVFIAFAFRGEFDMLAGSVLLSGLALMLGDAVWEARAHRAAVLAMPEEITAKTFDDDVEGADPDMPWWQIILFLGLGLIGLPLGADLLVDNASIIAKRYGVSDAVIGLTLVAIGTSLPELATTVMATLRQQADVALGNVIGSNMFNVLAIIGVSCFVGTIPVDQAFLQFDLWVMLAATILLAPFVFMKIDITRLWGVVLTALYGSYIFFVLT